MEEIGIYLIAESSTVENGKLNGHANGSVTSSTNKGGSPADAEVDPGPDGTRQAFLSLEQVETRQAKASVLEVFKKVNTQHWASKHWLMLHSHSDTENQIYHLDI